MMGLILVHSLCCRKGHINRGIYILYIAPLKSFLQSPIHSLWILGHRCTFQSHCHSQPHSGNCRSVGKLPRRIQENTSHYSRVPTSLAYRYTLQTWGDSWEHGWKEQVTFGWMTPKAHANIALAMITKCVGNSTHNNLNFIPRFCDI